MKLVIHLYVDGHNQCGTRGGNSVPPHLAKHVTCKRCLASLRKLGE